MNNWHVITGAQGAGKSSTIEYLEDSLGCLIIPEAGRTVIDEARAAGISTESLRKDEYEFQMTVARKKEATEATLNPSTLTLLDRGMHDTVAYLDTLGLATPKWIDEYCKKQQYKNVFVLEPLESYVNDYARTEDADFAQRLHIKLLRVYRRYGMECILVPVDTVEKRASFIKKYLE
ncbi:MAG TPA: ATP-binding protein [Candidatus Saccharimonadales bacterium]